jgi:hypothetical protein
MKANLGSIDRIIRIIIAVVIGILYFTDVITGVPGIILLVIAIALFATSIISFCPSYSILGINTCKRK